MLDVDVYIIHYTYIILHILQTINAGFKDLSFYCLLTYQFKRGNHYKDQNQAK